MNFAFLNFIAVPIYGAVWIVKQRGLAKLLNTFQMQFPQATGTII